MTFLANLNWLPTQALMRRVGSPALDADALDYIQRVEAADGQALEPAVKTAINDFVLGMKEDQNWDKLNVTCIMAGARTLNGALEPLTGTAPTNFNFVSDDYNRKTGLKGDGSTKYLDSNRSFTADAVDDVHISAYLTSAPIAGPGRYIAGRGNREVLENDPAPGFRTRFGSSTLYTLAAGLDATPCLIGCSRANLSKFSWRGYGTGGTQADTAGAEAGFSYRIFAQPSLNGIDATSYTAARLSFYSIGESIDLAALDTRVSNLMTAIDGAIA